MIEFNMNNPIGSAAEIARALTVEARKVRGDGTSLMDNEQARTLEIMAMDIRDTVTRLRRRTDMLDQAMGRMDARSTQ